MLTDTDIHYLVGLLTKVQSADDVVVELGDMVYDAKSNTKRDVDITVTDSSGQKSVYRGIEVKDHRRPLDTTQVEQLCIKLNDMPAITHRAIVSASGYTKPAVTKAKNHGIELLEIVDWPDPQKGFNVQFDTPGFMMFEYVWMERPHVRVNVAKEDYEAVRQALSDRLPVVDAGGQPFAHIKTLADLMNVVQQKASSKAREGANPPTIDTKEQMSININVDVGFSDGPHLDIDGQLIAIDSCHVTGALDPMIHDKPTFKILRVHGSDKPLTGCAVIELSNKNLTGISVSNLNNKVTALNIPYGDRLKKKIRGHRIGDSKPKPKNN